MGTQLDMLMVGSNEVRLRQIWHRVERCLGDLDYMMSRYREGGELYRLNRDARHQKFAVSRELWEVLSSCFDYYQKTSGYFDITLGCRSFIDINMREQSVVFLNDSVTLDLGGFGKGYALRKIGAIARDEDIDDLFVSFGNSSILAQGHHPSGDCWQISTCNPYNGEVLDSFELRNTTLTVSGNSPSNQGHIFDPYRGLFCQQHRLVSIVCDDPTLGEVLSTTGMLMGKDAFAKLLSSYNIKESKIVEL